MTIWSRQHTLNTGLIVIGLLVALSNGASLIASRRLVREHSALSSGEIRERSDSQMLRLAGLREIADVNTALLTGEAQFVRAARSGSAATRAQLARLEPQVVTEEGRVRFERVQTAEREYLEAFERALLAPEGRPAAAAVLGSRGPVLEQAIDALVEHMDRDSVAELGATRAGARRTEVGFNLVTTLSVVLAVLLCVLLITLINRAYREHKRERILAEKGQTTTTTALQEAKAAIHLKDEFLATVSHELRNPLAPILTWTQLLRSGTLPKEKFNRGLEVIELNVASLSELIDDLVDVSRVASGKFRLDVRPIDLVPVIRAAVESQRPASDARQIRLQLVLDERAGRISGDSERLQQVMGNLLSNAIKFTPKGGSVQVTLGRSESHVEMAVSDSGIGIEPAFLPHVFEPFRQATDGAIRRHAGLGLGLSIVRHIVELHGGEIAAESQGAGRGSRFTITLPLLGLGEPSDASRPRHPSAVDGLQSIRLQRLDRIRVLLVDDEPTANEALEALLDSCGAEVRTAGSAAQALRTLDDWAPDLLISDIAMPEEDGYSLVRRIRARGPAHGGDIPAVALTAYAKIEDRVNILAAGFQLYLSKPADPSELVAVVASLAASRRRVGSAGTQAPPNFD